MYFVVSLSKTLGQYDSIWVIVDRLTKFVHFVPIKVGYNIEKLDKIDVKDILQLRRVPFILRLHGVPFSIISDRGAQFTSKFWHKLQEELHTKLDLGIAFHPQTNRQFERVIQILKYMLQACVDDFGGHWDQFLSLCKFSYSNFIIPVLTQPHLKLYDQVITY